MESAEIYYQLRFGECCNRLNKAVDHTKNGGWSTEVYTGSDEVGLKNQIGFELSFFLELYDIVLGLWRPDVILRPLTHRFLRGAVQLVGRSVAFLLDGLEGKIKFGVEKVVDPTAQGNGNQADTNGSNFPYPTKTPYCWEIAHKMLPPYSVGVGHSGDNHS
jgi:hypothetical protein